jgi:dihydroorotate dehydrogenase electron transfer subunit
VSTFSVLARLESIEELYKNVFLAWLHCRQISSAAKPGQFIMVSCNDYLLRRPLAIHQVNQTKEAFAVLFAVCGKGTTWLSKQQPGTELSMLGPLGNGFSLAPEAQNILLVAGGLGIAPIRFVAQSAREAGKSVILLQGASTASCVYPANNLPEQVKCHIATEDGSCGAHCLVTDMLGDYIEWAEQILACGPNVMYHPIAARNNRLSSARPFQISLETRMGCGFGACYGCSIKTAAGMKKVCHDGPVFDYYEIVWDKNPGSQ